MMKKCILASVGGLLIASITVSADTLNLNDYVKLVLKNNPQPKIASSAVQASSAAYENVSFAIIASLDWQCSYFKVPITGHKNRGH